MRVLSSVSCFCPRYPLRTGLVRPVHGVSGGRVQSPRRRRERSPSPRFDSDAAVADAAGRVPSPRRHHERSPRLYSHSPGWPPAAVATGTLHPRSRSKTPPPNLRPNATALSSTPTSTSDSDCDADAAHRVSSPRRNQSAPKPMIYSGRGSRVATSGMATYSEAEAMADAWEKEKMAKIKKQYNETMDTIADSEAEKKAKARLPAWSDSERKHAKVLEYYKDEMSRINKVVAASRLTAEEKRRNVETKVREKADKVDGEASLDLWLLLKPCVHPPSTCGC